MKLKSKYKTMTFGDFVVGVYHTWGARKANGVIKLAIKMHVIKFCGAEVLVIA
jgi:hypothetical protein